MNATPTRAPTQKTATKTVAKPASTTEAIDAFDVLERIGSIGIHWWSVIDSVLEAHTHHQNVYPDPIEPLPQWAVERLKDQGRHRACEEEFSVQRRLLKDWLHLSTGDGHQCRYEVWTSRGARLAFRHESWVDAAEVLQRLKPQHPDAFVARVHVLSAPAGVIRDPELLNTLVGRIAHIGTYMGGLDIEDTEEMYTVQDDTGRQVTVRASTLKEHEVYQRLDARGKESLDFYLSTIKPRRAAARAADKGEGL